MWFALGNNGSKPCCRGSWCLNTRKPRIAGLRAAPGAIRAARAESRQHAGRAAPRSSAQDRDGPSHYLHVQPLGAIDRLPRAPDGGLEHPGPRLQARHRTRPQVLDPSGHQQAGFGAATILGIAETCRRRGRLLRDDLLDILPGMAARTSREGAKRTSVHRKAARSRAPVDQRGHGVGLTDTFRQPISWRGRQCSRWPISVCCKRIPGVAAFLCFLTESNWRRPESRRRPSGP